MRTLLFGCVGSRGDVQLFVNLGQALQRNLRCRVVVASGVQRLGKPLMLDRHRR